MTECGEKKYRRELCGERLNEDIMSIDDTSREIVDEDTQSTEEEQLRESVS